MHCPYLQKRQLNGQKQPRSIPHQDAKAVTGAYLKKHKKADSKDGGSFDTHARLLKWQLPFWILSSFRTAACNGRRPVVLEINSTTPTSSDRGG